MENWLLPVILALIAAIPVVWGVRVQITKTRIDHVGNFINEIQEDRAELRKQNFELRIYTNELEDELDQLRDWIREKGMTPPPRMRSERRK